MRWSDSRRRASRTAAYASNRRLSSSSPFVEPLAELGRLRRAARRRRAPGTRARASRCTRPAPAGASSAGLRRSGGPSRTIRGRSTSRRRVAVARVAHPERDGGGARRRYSGVASTSQSVAVEPARADDVPPPAQRLERRDVPNERLRRRRRACGAPARPSARPRRRRRGSGSSTTSIRFAATAHEPAPRRTASARYGGVELRSTASASGARSSGPSPRRRASRRGARRTPPRSPSSSGARRVTTASHSPRPRDAVDAGLAPVRPRCRQAPTGSSPPSRASRT